MTTIGWALGALVLGLAVSLACRGRRTVASGWALAGSMAAGLVAVIVLCARGELSLIGGFAGLMCVLVGAALAERDTRWRFGLRGALAVGLGAAIATSGVLDATSAVVAAPPEQYARAVADPVTLLGLAVVVGVLGFGWSSLLASESGETGRGPSALLLWGVLFLGTSVAMTSLVLWAGDHKITGELPAAAVLALKMEFLGLGLVVLGVALLPASLVVMLAMDAQRTH